MNLILNDVSLPALFRFRKPMNDRELMQFSTDNGDLRIEQEPGGEILVLLPASSYCGSIEMELGFKLQLWNRANGSGRTFGAGLGFSLLDGAVRAASAVWISSFRWNGIGDIERERYATVCPEFVEARSVCDRLARLTSKTDALGRQRCGIGLAY